MYGYVHNMYYQFAIFTSVCPELWHAAVFQIQKYSLILRQYYANFTKYKFVAK